MITQQGYDRIIELDSIRAIRLFLKLVQLSEGNGNITVTQTELTRELGLKNKANVNVTMSELIQKDFIRKKVEKNKITYFINPKISVTQKGYEVLQREYDDCSIDFDTLFNEIVGGVIND